MSYLALSRADSNHGFAIFLLRIAVFSVAAVIATAGLAHAQCQNDVDGANDEPGQKDITSVCLTPGDGLPYEWEVVTNWDETTLTGANTADVCTLYDINSNSLADLAVCVTLESSGAMNGNLAVFQQFRLYTCGDTRGDRCAGSTQLVGAFTTTCSAAQAASDPFPPAAVNGPGDKFPDDTEIECLIDLDDFGAAGANAELLDACSYPSQQPGSDCRRRLQRFQRVHHRHMRAGRNLRVHARPRRFLYGRILLQWRRDLQQPGPLREPRTSRLRRRCVVYGGHLRRADRPMHQRSSQLTLRGRFIL
jgi:hypothetical protein